MAPAIIPRIRARALADATAQLTTHIAMGSHAWPPLGGALLKPSRWPRAHFREDSFSASADKEHLGTRPLTAIDFALSPRP